MTNTAIGASGSNQTIIFRNNTHKEFYQKYLLRCRYQDVYHKALIYCLGIDENTRRKILRIYDFKTGNVKIGCLHESWISGGSAKVIRMAFNLYCNQAPSIKESDSSEEQLRECQEYTIKALFCCEYAKYFWEAIKIRYPEYCFYRDWEEEDVKG